MNVIVLISKDDGTAGYEDRGDFLQLIQDITGEENWDRNLDKGDKFFIPKPVSETEIELAPPDYGDAESEMQLPVQLMQNKKNTIQPMVLPTRVMERGYVICGTKENFAGFSEKKMVDVEDRWVGFDADICRAVAVAVFGDVMLLTMW